MAGGAFEPEASLEAQGAFDLDLELEVGHVLAVEMVDAVVDGGLVHTVLLHLGNLVGGLRHAGVAQDGGGVEGFAVGKAGLEAFDVGIGEGIILQAERLGGLDTGLGQAVEDLFRLADEHDIVAFLEDRRSDEEVYRTVFQWDIDVSAEKATSGVINIGIGGHEDGVESGIAHEAAYLCVTEREFCAHLRSDKFRVGHNDAKLQKICGKTINTGGSGVIKSILPPFSYNAERGQKDKPRAAARGTYKQATPGPTLVLGRAKAKAQRSSLQFLFFIFYFKEMLVTIFGYAAAICMICGYLPQAIYTIRTRDTDGIAMPTFLLMFLGSIFFVVQGAMLGNLPLVITNAITGLSSLIVTVIKIHNDYFKKK